MLNVVVAVVFTAAVTLPMVFVTLRQPLVKQA